MTPKGKSTFPEDDPLYLGVLGFGGHESVIAYLEQQPDVVLVCGSSLNDFSTNAWTPLLTAQKAFMQIDVDASQIGKNYPVQLGLLGPVHEVVTAMLPHVREPLPRPPHPPFVMQRAPKSVHGKLSTLDVAHAMSEVCPRDAYFTSDMGEHLSAALHALRTRSAGTFITCLGFGSLGSGIVSAIGLALGDRRRRTFALCGDGGFLMSGNELQTAVRAQAPVTFVIANDARYNMCHHGMKDQYGKTPDCGLGRVDFARMADAFGATGCSVRTEQELYAALRLRQGPVVIDVDVDPDVRLAGSQRVAALRQFSQS